MKNNHSESSGPKDAATSKGPNASALGALASTFDYPKVTPRRKGKSGAGPDDRSLAQSAHARARVDMTKSRPDFGQAAFRASEGRTWRFRGKRARVVTMLATMSQGVTQWDCLPWHTRLGGTIHALRRDGLEISTELEGDYRHARYRLCTRGCLIKQAENSDGSNFLTPGKAS